MSDGPKKVKPDYKGMWKNYSGWMQEEDARAKRELSSARAKLAMRGVKQGSTAWNAMMEQTQATLDKDRKSISGGYTAKELKKTFAGALAGPYRRSAKYSYFEKGVAPEIEKAGGLDKYIDTLQKDYDSLQESVERHKGLDWEDQQHDWTGMANTHKSMGLAGQLSTLKVARAGMETLKASGYENPELWEGYFAGRYGNRKFNPTEPTKEEKSMEQAKKAGGGQAAFQMGAAPAGGTASPWMSANKDEDKLNTASPNM